jgi:hypothetical protein
VIAEPTVVPEAAVPKPLDATQMRQQVLGAALLGGLSVGVSVVSCVGQSFNLRQARALEAIEHQLETLTSTRGCAPPALHENADAKPTAAHGVP